MIILRSSSLEPPYFRYEFDPISNHYTATPCQTWQEAGVGARGSADVRMIGVRRKREVFAALYSFEGSLHAAVLPHHFVWPGPYTAARRTIFDRVKRFRVTQGDERVLQFYYTFIDERYSFPGPEVIDIFYEIAWVTSRMHDVKTYIYALEARANGEDVGNAEFQQKLRSL